MTRWRPIIVAAVVCAASAAIALWVLHPPLSGHWLQVHTGTVNEPGPYYGFWSGFGSDLEEFGILGAIGAGIYQLVKKYNCHEPGCWRVGQCKQSQAQTTAGPLTSPLPLRAYLACPRCRGKS